MYSVNEVPETTILELNKLLNKQAYLIWKDTGDIWFDTRKYLMEKFFESENCDIIPGDFDEEEIKSYYVFVLDPESLPFDLEYKGKLSDREYKIVIFWESNPRNISMEEFDLDNMEEATGFIEKMIENEEITDFSEVAVVIAKPMKLAVTFRESGDSILEKEIYRD